MYICSIYIYIHTYMLHTYIYIYTDLSLLISCSNFYSNVVVILGCLFLYSKSSYFQVINVFNLASAVYPSLHVFISFPFFLMA